MSDAVRRIGPPGTVRARARWPPSTGATGSSSGSPRSRRSTSASWPATLSVSEMTIRRDIRGLERDGFVRQTYGGATAHITKSLDIAFNARALQHTREKRRIGMRATQLLGDARVVFVGIGTTAEQFARFLPVQPGLVVVTASLPTASLLGTRPVDVVALGGTVRRDELTCVGPAAAATLARFRFDLAVIGAAGTAAHAGASPSSTTPTPRSSAWPSNARTGWSSSPTARRSAARPTRWSPRRRPIRPW